MRSTLLPFLAFALSCLSVPAVAEESEEEEFDWSVFDDEPIDYSSQTTAEEVPFEGRAGSRVDAEALQRRQPRSAPDALRYEPGVYIQQTAQGQASPYIRGRTGQQTVLLFDGVRLNNSLFRQGPNQYFFTVDSSTIDHIDVLRGSASTVFGSDAIAGAIEAVPLAPLRDPHIEGVAIAPRYFLDVDTSSDGIGQRVQTDVQLSPSSGILAGVGYRSFGLLRSGGFVTGLRGDELPEVPRFAEDGKTQLGTGFDEFTGDIRWVQRLSGDLDFVAGVYNYRQTDAPRTDQCAPPFAPFNECLTYDEQFRTLAYVGLDGDPGSLEDFQLRLSWQRQHERRTHDRPSSSTINGGLDDVDSFGLRAHSQVAGVSLRQWGRLEVDAGVDGYHDRVSSAAWLEFSDINIIRHRSRGQYLDGSSYSTLGAFAQGSLRAFDRIRFRAGGRVSSAFANAPADPETDSSAVDREWAAFVGNLGVEVAATPQLKFFAGADQGFRAPNLDDLTSRQRTGPGYQLENSELKPEHALTLEGGVAVRHRWLALDAWVYRMTLQDAVSRATRSVNDCPEGNADCRNAWNVLQLVNVPGTAVIRGAELSAAVESEVGLDARATLTWAVGDEPDPSGGDERTPISRVPPMNGTFELHWAHESGIWLGGASRWALQQDRLSAGDIADERIPRGGTPGYAVFDLRAGYRIDQFFAGSIVLENLGDTAYRAHGSSVNGPGRSVLLHLEFGFTTQQPQENENEPDAILL
ncbi:MAG: iron complex outermembrane receptor protein/hemoglobin/transferrin/lactoferrin receptor protein [Bradymonadia bacterium]|jgi:iron complex outermembrane receptor protein/hemoglobin/transferrin/lactoferrin receptor protein